MKNNNKTEKKTRKKLSKEIGISEKTMREKIRYCDNITKIDENIGEERATKFNEIICSLQNNKKKSISDEQIRELSKMSADEQIRIVDRVIKHPNNAKMIINNAIPYCKTKITVTLPSFINDWYIDVAEENYKSRGKYIEEVLVGFYNANSNTTL